MQKNGVKFTKENIVFITKDATGQTVWLEKGNSSAGLKHILDGNGVTKGHAADFQQAFGISESEIPGSVAITCTAIELFTKILYNKSNC